MLRPSLGKRDYNAGLAARHGSVLLPHASGNALQFAACLVVSIATIGGQPQPVEGADQENLFRSLVRRAASQVGALDRRFQVSFLLVCRDRKAQAAEDFRYVSWRR